ncbi:MAG: TM1812 family CRISPR-associated protein [Oscillospiraceae bacterium]|nr:TM1812 family CRISPR-associated protein [Oscillospiraceae bacterium]
MKSILITGLSVVRSDQAEKVYTSDIGEVYGRYSMDAPSMYFLKKLHRNQKCLDSIICLATPETLTPQEEMKESAYEIYRSTIQHYCDMLGCTVPDIKHVELAFGKSDMNRIIQNIMDLLPEDAEIYLDTTGGARNTSYILLLLTRFLAYQGIRLQQAVYGNYQFGNNNHSIEDVTILYNMFSLINAANTFTAFGNATELLEYFKDTESTEIRNLLDAMVKFSDAVMLCDTRLDQKIEHLKSCFQRMQGYEPQNDAESVLLLLMDTIRQKLYLSESHSTIPYPELIRWCMENSMIQQAVTIYAEKIPEYLFNEGIIQKTKEFPISTLNGFSEAYRLFYYELYNLSSRHSPFHDTLQKCLSDDEQRQIFYHCQNLQEFRRKASIIDVFEPEVLDLIEKLINFKNCLFNCHTLDAYPKYKRQIKLKNFAQYPEFQELIKKVSPNTTIEGFFNSVMNDRKFGEILQGNVEQKKLSCKPETIRHLEKYLTADCGLAVAKGIHPDTLRQFLTVTLFIKTSIRNQLNHASDHREESREDFGTFFEEHGYHPADAGSVNGIREVITKALDLLDQIQKSTD